MTDKQIIIEDCPYFIGGNCQEYLDGVCENHKCDLKIIRELETKLKAKEQECEELKNERTVDLVKQLDQLKAENDNLKSLIWWIHIGAEGADKATTEYYENRNTPYEENYWKRIRALQPPTYESKYKLALTEIKEIAENAKKDICNNCGWRNTDSCDPEDYTCGEFIKILQEISECEGNNG